MSKVFNITDADNFFIGEDKIVEIDVVQSDDVTPQTMTSWNLVYEIKATARGLALISETPTIGNGDGTDDRATANIGDTQTEALRPATYYHQLRRTDAGAEQVLAHGTVVLKESGL